MKLFFFILFFIPLITFCQDEPGYQPGYIVMNSGDTLRGLIKHINPFPYQVLYRKIKFEKDEKSKVQVLTPEEIKEFVYPGDAKYRSIRIDNGDKKDFLKVEKEGYLNYYTITVTVGPGKSYFQDIVQATDEKIQRSIKPSNKFKDNMVQFVADDTALCEKIKSGEYKKKDIISIVDEYNAFRSKDKPVINAKALPVKDYSNNCDGQYFVLTEKNAIFKNGETAFIDSLNDYLRTQHIALAKGYVTFRLVIFLDGTTSDVTRSGGRIDNADALLDWILNAHDLFLPAMQGGNKVCSYQHLKIETLEDGKIQASIF